MKRWAEDEANAIRVTASPKKVIDESTVPPVFIHTEINDLYAYGCEISPEVITKIKALPRETLIKDLNAVVYDSIARFAVFRRYAGNYNATWFPVHALFILRDLEAEESLEVILDFLSQDADFLDFWLGDILTEDYWAIIAACAKSDLPRLSAFMKEPGRYTYARTEVAEAVNQLALHSIIPRQHAIDFFRDILEFYLENSHAENLIDTDLNGLLIGVVLDLQATDLAPHVRQMLESRLASEMIAGDWKTVEKEFGKPPRSFAKREFESMESVYHTIKKNMEQESDNEDYLEEDLEADDESYNYEPYVRETPKTGRNDPCPCGSEKKFKKCHGKEF